MHVIGTAGHVDHGKSTLVRRLTGIDPDRFEEEKRRGLTIDLGFAWLTLPSGNEIGIVDVPGHERFIKNMLAGAGGVSVCLFVVAANEGWKPQSAEHLSILDVLGVSNGVVAVTKSDLVDDDTLELAMEDTREHIADSTLATAPVIPCSATTGTGIAQLIQALDATIAEVPPPPDRNRPRLWIDRVFTIAGAGTVVTGTLAGGSFARGQEVEISPAGRRARIRSIQSHKKEVDRIEPGNRVALNLVGLDRAGAERGDAVVAAGAWRPTRTIDARVRVLDPKLSGHQHELTEKGAHLLYAGAAETPARLRLLGAQKLRAGEEGFAQIVLRDALPLARGDRFVLRDAGRVLTFGGGEVLDPMPPPARRNDEERRRLLERLGRASDAEALDLLVEATGTLDVRDALIRTGVDEISDHIVRHGRTLYSAAAARELQERIGGALAAHHAQHPLDKGMPREALRAEIGLEPGDFDDVVHGSNDVVEEGTLIRLTSHEVTLAPEDESRANEIVERIGNGGFTPPLAGELDADPQLLKALIDAGKIVKIGDFYLTAESARDARAKVRQKIEETGPVTVAEIRDLLGTSRKYAVPLSEWLDATGATIRRGDVRHRGPND